MVATGLGAPVEAATAATVGALYILNLNRFKLFVSNPSSLIVIRYKLLVKLLEDNVITPGVPSSALYSAI